MATLEELAQSISETCADYRNEELGPFTAEHVLHWVGQLDADEQGPVLAELDHVLKKTYFSEAGVTEFLESLAKEPQLVGNDPATFWKTAGILAIQQGGNSQAEMLERFDAVLQGQFGFGVNECEASSGTFIYVDDAIFTGNRFRRDLEPWINGAAPETAKVHIIVNAQHTGSYYAKDQVDKAAREAGKKISFMRWHVREIENRKNSRNSSEVLWPTAFAEGGQDEVSAYVAMLTNANYPPVKRVPGWTPKNGIFSGEEGRAALENAFLKAGVHIRSICPFLPDTARPLGFSLLKTFGFGATVVTYRNCPNNCPLALWAGNPWYPLFRRKTN